MELAVNDALVEIFLGGRFEGRPLYLVLDNQGRQRLADMLCQDAEEVEAYCCASTGTRLNRTGDPFASFELDLWKWNLTLRRTPPPFLDLLFTLSHAAEQMVSDGDFSLGNYYDRLAALVHTPSQRLQLNGKTTEQFWRSFNKWLADSDFAFGRPTARAINANKYVSIAMSQAIVREADRQRFRLLFEKYPALGTSQATDNDIEQYLSAWMRTSQPTKQLKEAWKKAELRGRISEAAVGELAEWQEECAEHDAGGNSTGQARLSLALKIGKGLFGRSMSAYLGRAEAIDPIPLKDAFGSSVELANWTFGAFATLEPRSASALASAMGNGIQLIAPSGRSFGWKPKPIMVFALNDQGLWIETSRVSLNTRHLVLARDEKFSREAVESALSAIALAGFKCSNPSSLPGLPVGCIAYEDVVVTRALSDFKGFEIALSPVGEVASLLLEGGMRLGKDIWHNWMPPVITFMGESQSCSIQVFEGSDDQGEFLGEANGDNYVELDTSAFKDKLGNVFVQARMGKTIAATSSLLFRSANRPRVLDRQAAGKVQLTGVLSSKVGGESDESLVRGLKVPGDRPSPVEDTWLSGFAKMGSVVNREKQESESPSLTEQQVMAPSKPRTAEEFEAMTCAERGKHLPRYETVLPGTSKYAPIDVECRKCGETWVHRRPRPSSQNEGGQKEVMRVRPVQFAGNSHDVDFDLCLDGAGFLGTGTTANIETFVEALGVDSWIAGVVLKHLSWLGHIDVESSNTFRPRFWSVAPPALSMLGKQRAVLAGFRSQQLVDSLAKAVEIAGGNIVRVAQKNGPAAIFVTGLRHDELESALQNVTDNHARTISVVEDVAPRLLGFLGKPGSLMELFRPVTVGTGLPIQRYDVSANKWRNADAISTGAYRVAGAGTNYIFVAPSGKAHAGPHEMVKLAAARLEGLSLHAYDPLKMQFSSRIGCEPLGLLSRALVAQSGELPNIEGSTSIFKDVSRPVAAGVIKWLYEGRLPG